MRRAGLVSSGGARGSPILLMPTGAPQCRGGANYGPHGGGLSGIVRGVIVAICESVRALVRFECEPGFSVGGGLRVVVDSSGTGFLLIREDRSIVLEWSAGGGMVSVTVSDLLPSEKRAVTRVVRVIRPAFTPDWNKWRGMRRRALGCRTMLAVRPL